MLADVKRSTQFWVQLNTMVFSTKNYVVVVVVVTPPLLRDGGTA